jgi:RNA polymerase sigma-70 factor (ECF subfamily)
MLTTVSNEDLLLRVAREDREAFAELHDRFKGLVRAAATRVLGSCAEVDDVCQEVFLSLWKEASRFDPARGSPSTWIGLMARRRAVDSLRVKIHRGLKVRCFDDDASSIPHDPHIVGACERKESTVLAREVMARLPEDQRTALTLTFFRGLKGRHIAALQKVPDATVKTRLRRGIQRMRGMLDTEANAA